jgi:hypothetical protein
MITCRSIIISDDIRKEDNGKELLIGVYSGGIRFLAERPGKLRQLCFRLELEYDGGDRKASFGFEFAAPSGTVLINIPERQIQLAAEHGRAIVVLSHFDLVMYEEGRHAIKVTTDAGVFRDTVDVSFEGPTT